MKKNSADSNENYKQSIAGIILAAGLSSRMKDFKPLLKYNGKSFLQNIITKLSNVCDKVVVVTGHNASMIEKEISLINSTIDIITVFNENYKEGMFASLQTGLKSLNNYEWALYHFVDQPTIQQNVYNEIVLKLHRQYHWIQPTNSNRKGHPILLGTTAIKLILSADPKSNLKHISQSDSIRKKYIDVEDNSIFFVFVTQKDFVIL